MLLSLVLCVACRSGPSPGKGPALADSELLLFLSQDGTSFSQVDTPARGFDSLGLTDDGEQVVITGLDHRRHIPWYERYRDPQVQELVWDGQGFTRRSRSLPVDALALIDPQWQGEQLWYVARDGAGDPALGGENRVMRGSELQLKGPGLADPSPVRFQDQELLFTTRWGDGVVLWSGSPWQEQTRWPQLTVPFARVEGAGDRAVLALYAVGVVRGKRLPVRLESRDGRTFGPPEALSLSPEPSSCTSPVLWSAEDGLRLLCVHEATSPPQ